MPWRPSGFQRTPLGGKHPYLHLQASPEAPMNWEEVPKVVAAVLGVLSPLIGLCYYLIKRWAKSVKKHADSEVDAARRDAGARVKMAEAEAGKRIADLGTNHAQAMLALQQDDI